MSTSSTVLLIGLFLLLFLGMINIIKMRWINKKPSRLGTQVTGQALMMQWMNEQKRTAMEEVIYQQEEQEEDSEYCSSCCRGHFQSKKFTSEIEFIF
jgi:hypothetical protein